jgi:hypothetical protein
MNKLQKIRTATITLIVSSVALFAQKDAGKCISGNCNNGVGKFAYTSPRSLVYSGSFKNGKMHGSGTLTYESGYKFVGNWLNGQLISGNGLLFDGENSYEGQVANGKFNGTGTYTYINGKQLKGTFKDGNLSYGMGYYILPDSSVYEGGMTNGKMHGQGELKFKSGVRYTGQFTNGEITGWGSMHTPSGDKTTGNFINGVINGEYCSFEGKDGSKYRGTYKLGIFHGFGEYRFPDGTKYVGRWIDGKCEGEGRLYDTRGNLVYEGAWKNHQMVNPEKAVRPVAPASTPTASYSSSSTSSRSSSSSSSSNSSSTKSADWEEVKKIFERHTFTGAQEQEIEGFEGDAIRISFTLYIDSNYKINGSTTSTVEVDNRKYSTTTSLTGSYNPGNQSLHLVYGRTLSADPLPNGLRWFSGGYSDAKIYYHSDHPGYYLIKGKTNGGLNYEVSDY